MWASPALTEAHTPSRRAAAGSQSASACSLPWTPTPLCVCRPLRRAALRGPTSRRTSATPPASRRVGRRRGSTVCGSGRRATSAHKKLVTGSGRCADKQCCFFVPAAQKWEDLELIFAGQRMADGKQLADYHVPPVGAEHGRVACCRMCGSLPARQEADHQYCRRRVLLHRWLHRQVCRTGCGKNQRNTPSC